MNGCGILYFFVLVVFMEVIIWLLFFDLGVGKLFMWDKFDLFYK